MRNKSNQIKKARSTIQLFSIMTVCVLLMSLGTVSINTRADSGTNIKTITKELSYPEPVIIQDESGYVKIQVGDLVVGGQPGEPQLPASTETVELPLSAKNIQIQFTPTAPVIKQLPGKIIPGPIPELQDERNYPLMRAALALYAKFAQARGLSLNGLPYMNSDATSSINNQIYTSQSSFGEQFTSELGVGRNSNADMVIYAVGRIRPVIYSNPLENEITYILGGTLTITYEEGSDLSTLTSPTHYDLLIIAPRGFIRDLTPLVDHKESKGIKTLLVSIDEIASEKYFENPSWIRDDAEQIKYFIYNAWKEWNITYVLAVGGFRTFWGLNDPTREFPIRYSHNVDGEPGYHTEQYFSSFLRTDPVEGLVFDTWDSNKNNRFAEWDFEGWDQYDPFPDVYWGRLACTNNKEVRTMVDKIMFYEDNTYGQEWFQRFLSAAGDSFQDTGLRTDLTIDWDTSALPDGDYTLSAISEVGELKGPQDNVVITVDHNATSKVHFSDTSHLKIEPLTEDQENLYPARPVAEIVVPSDGDILGTTSVLYMPDPENEAYCTQLTGWGNVDYNGTTHILKIKSKAYNPAPMSPYTGPSTATLKLWINNSDKQTVLGPVLKVSQNWWEDEMAAEQAVIDLGSSFTPVRLWTSNGNLTGMLDLLNGFSEGEGFAYINGHSSCMVWGNHYPCVPGGRSNGQINGWATINLRYGLERYQATQGDPLFPLDQLTNGYKLPVLLYSGCHSGQFDTSFMSMLSDPISVFWGERYGTWTPEGVAWWITRLPQGGSIATIGNGGLGSGYLGNNHLEGYVGWIYPHFFSLYSTFKNQGRSLNIGAIYTQLLVDYHLLPEHGDAIHNQGTRKHWEQLDLLGDPTLVIGGYPPGTSLGATEEDESEGLESGPSSGLPILESTTPLQIVPLSTTIFKVTTNFLNDISPEGFVYNESGDKFIVGYTRQVPEFSSTRNLPGFAYSNGGALWTEMVFGTPDAGGHTSLYSFTDTKGVQHVIGGVVVDPKVINVFSFADITNPNTWGTIGNRWIIDTQGEVACTGYLDATGTLQYAGLWGQNNDRALILIDEGVNQGGNNGMLDISEQVRHFNAYADQSTDWHYFVCQNKTTEAGIVVAALPPGVLSTSFRQTRFTDGFGSPDVVADNGWVYIVSESGSSIVCRGSNDNGVTWSSPITVTSSGADPEVLLTSNGNVECYFVGVDGNIFKASSSDHGVTWTAATQFGTAQTNSASLYSPFQVLPQGIVFNKLGNESDIFAEILIPTKGVVLDELTLDASRTVITTIRNAGTTYLDHLKWEITMTGISPIGQYTGSSPIMIFLFKGRIFKGGSTSGTIALSVGETEDISSNPVFGFGHIMITVQVLDDETVLAETSKDAFLLGRNILLDYSEE